MPRISPLLGVLVTACFAPRGDAPPNNDTLDGCVASSSSDLLGDGNDQNCDGVDGTDADGDGIPSEPSGGLDCDDQDPQIIPTADLDNDGVTACEDCDDQDPNAAIGDIDGDGFTECDGDCAPTKAWLHPFDDDGDGILEACGYRDVWCQKEGGIAIASNGEPIYFGSGNPWIAPSNISFRSLGEGLRPCGVSLTGFAACFQDGSSTNPPPVSSIAVEDGVLLDDGLRLQFWEGLSAAPEGEFLAFVGTDDTGAGLRTDGTVLHWGSFSEQAPSGPFSALSGDNATRCGITARGAECWGYTTDWTTRTVAGTFTDIRSGRGGGCALDEAGYLTCWGHPRTPTPPLDVPIRTFTFHPVTPPSWGEPDRGYGWVTMTGEAYCHTGKAP